MALETLYLPLHVTLPLLPYLILSNALLARYLEEKWKEAGNGNIALHGETFPLVQPNAPTQINGCDCGVYVLRYAKARQAGSGFFFSQEFILEKGT